MENKNDNKKKLEQHKLLINNRIRQINKRQDDLMLRNILFNAEKEELENKRILVQELINKLTDDLSNPRQVIKVKFLVWNSITLSLN